jgi:hypothetical protein
LGRIFFFGFGDFEIFEIEEFLKRIVHYKIKKSSDILKEQTRPSFMILPNHQQGLEAQLHGGQKQTSVMLQLQQPKGRKLNICTKNF